jgi:hypothetical protein
MITWTDSARATLANHSQTVRQQLLATGADPDEVAADLHRHIEEELTAAKIHVVTRDDVQRILARIGAPVVEVSTPVSLPKTIQLKALLIPIALVALLAASLLFLPILHNRPKSPPTAKQLGAEFPYIIDFVGYIPGWGQFASGDEIVITVLRGDRKRIEPGGRYLVEGTYTLASMDRARLALSMTAPSSDSPGAIAPWYADQTTDVARGAGHFSLKETMRYAGSFHVSFYPMGGGESRGTICFGEGTPGSAKAAEPPR